jgi:hypothetical protein
VKSVSSALVIAALLVGMASAAAASAATETVSLGFKEETAPEPAPLFEPPAVENPVSFTVTYTATPVQPLEIRQALYCKRGSELTGVPEKLETVTPPITISLTAPTGSDSCALTAAAEPPVGPIVFGTARIEAEAIRVSKSQSTPPPASKKKCKKGRKLKHGKCVKKGRKKHPHRRTHQL